jgi:PAS domain S-box-containing protein
MTDTQAGEPGQPRAAAPGQQPATPEQATLRILADNVPSQYSYVDAGEVYRYVNRRYVQRFGLPADRIVGRSVREILGPERYSIARPYIEGVLAGQPQHYEHEFAFVDGIHMMDVIYTPDTAEDGSVRGFFVLVHDITERKALERDLSASRSHLAAIIDTAADGIITVNSQGIIRDFNPAAERMFGRTGDSMIGQQARLFLPPTCQDCSEYPTCFRSGQCPHNSVHPQELTGQRLDGSRFPMEITVNRIDDHDLYVILLRDISERRQLERDIIQAATQEQARLGREIHDGIGQQLTAISLLARGVEQRLTAAGQPGQAAEVGKLVEHLQIALNQAHLLAQGLAPVEIDPEGLSDALNELTRNVQDSSSIACRYHGGPGIKVHDRDTALHLYRIAQEAVNNALKHGKPHRIDVRLGRTDDTLVLTVQDDGSGMRDTGGRRGRLGLPLMRYRAGIIGGELQIESVAGNGTRVRCLIPVQE